jgi:uroporphyrin-III C-methyltransferase
MIERGRQGRVYLVGAGPGDPELLTLKAARCIASADAILLDALVDRRVLSHAKPGARIVDVGKRGGCRSTSQEFIDRLMVRLARRGAVVARVKGGDPFVFGRGGEEAMALARAGVAFEVIPGLTSGIAAPASAGIPVTHRGVANAVTLVSGHSLGNADWQALARLKGTLVIYMAVAHLGRVVDALLAAGRDGATPAAAIERGSWQSQRIVRATLAGLPAEASRASLSSPAILVVGECVGLADQIAPGAVASQLAWVA